MRTRHNNLDWMDFMAITVVVIICLIAFLSGGCYADRVVVRTEVKWHHAPVTCLTLPAPAKPKDVYCYTDFASLPSASYEECETIQAAQWAEYGKNAFIWIHNYVEPMCYEAVGRAGGPQ
jgi:hypothetical protein